MRATDLDREPDTAAKRGAGSSRLVREDGSVRLGIHDAPVDEINFDDHPYRTPFGKRVAAWRRRRAYHQFHFVGALSEDATFGCAIIDAGWITNAFVTFYDPAARTFDARSFQAPGRRGLHFDPRPEDGTSRFRRGSSELRIDAVPGGRELFVDLPGPIRIEARFDEAGGRVEPLRIATRSGVNGWVFARKTAGFPVSGEIDWKGRKASLEPARAFGHVDWSGGFMRRETWWNWGCLSGLAADGRVVGMNVSCGVNETSWTENGFWIDGRFEKVDLVSFDYDVEALERPWTVSSRDGKVDLRFEPEATHAECTNAVWLGSRFHQMIGRWTGLLRPASGPAVSIDGMLGYAEEQFARW